MSKDSMDVYALDSDFNLITIAIPYDNMQWTRRYYESGQFSMQVSLKVYDTNWAYIGTADRPELGMVQKIEVQDSSLVLISGFFCEAMLNDKVCYPRYIGDVSKTETAVRNIFTKYKEDLPITLAPPNDPLLGDRTQSDFSDNELGKKLYSILESRECTYSVVYDYINNRLQLKVWQGKDRTQSQNVNSFQTFSMEFGNIVGREIDFDDSAFKNYAIVPCNADDNDIEQNTYYLDWSNGGYKKKIVFDMRSALPDEEQSMADFQAAILQEASEKLADYAKIEDVNVDVVEAGYMEDFDIGDKCDVILTDIGITMETRIVEVNEVFKDKDHTVTVGLGNKRISNVRRAVNSI